MSAKLLETTFKGRETIRVTTANAIPMKDLQNGHEFNYVGYVIQEIVNEENGEVFPSILVKDEDGNVYATRSETFTEQLKDILVMIDEVDVAGEESEPIRIKIIKAQSKNNKEFITCALA